jgi:hypothetical protein
MQRQFRKQVKIVRSPDLPENRAISAAKGHQSQRDTRPGHFTIKGSFITLPGHGDANSEARRG